MKKTSFAVALATCFAAPLSAADRPASVPSDAAARFGAREDIQQVSLSPSGTSIAYVAAINGRGAGLFVVSIADGVAKPILASSGDPDRLTSCKWSTDTRLVCGIYMILETSGLTHRGYNGYTRLIALDSDGKNLKVLSARTNDRSLGAAFGGGEVIDWNGGAPGTVLLTRRYVPEATTGSLLAETREGFGVDRIDTNTLRRATVEAPNDSAVDYISDGYGAVRIMGKQIKLNSGYNSDTILYSYRKAGDRNWLPLGTLKTTGGVLSGFNPYAVDRDRNLVYGVDSKDERKALFSVALDGSLTKTLVLDRPDVDVDDLIRIGRQGRVVGASFITDKRQSAFFDPELKALAASLSRALPGLPLVTFVDASADESKVLLFAGSDVDPGHYYLYDKATRRLAEAFPARAGLAKTTLAAVKPVSFTAADGTQIPAYLTLPPGSDGKNLPTIVMPHGGPEARDEWGFDWLSQFFANRGYAVLQPNYRGSTGYGIAWFNDNGFKSWRTAIGDVNDGGRWLVKQGIADPAKLAIVGWSYGGYAALQSAVLDPALFKAIVAVAPVTDLETLRQERHDYTDFTEQDARIGKGPHVREGSPAQNAARITAPVLLFHGDRDQNVGIEESRLMAARLKAAGKSVELVEFPHLDHQLDDSSARAMLLGKADGFLRTTLKLPAQ
ncbi:alpha/beta hydrolase family protein [Sphingomonas sp. UYP23]